MIQLLNYTKEFNLIFQILLGGILYILSLIIFKFFDEYDVSIFKGIFYKKSVK